MSPHDLRNQYTGPSAPQHTGSTALPPYPPNSPRPPTIATFARIPVDEPPSYATAWGQPAPTDVAQAAPASGGSPFAVPAEMSLYDAELLAYRQALGAYHEKGRGKGQQEKEKRKGEGMRFAPPPVPEPPLTPPPEEYTVVDLCESVGHDTSPRLPGVIATAALFPLSMVWHATRKTAKCNRCNKTVPIESWCGSNNSCGRQQRPRKSCGSSNWENKCGGNRGWQNDNNWDSGWQQQNNSCGSKRQNTCGRREKTCGPRARHSDHPKSWNEWTDPRNATQGDWKHEQKGAWEAASASSSASSSGSSSCGSRSRCGERREARRCGSKARC